MADAAAATAPAMLETGCARSAAGCVLAGVRE